MRGKLFLVALIFVLCAIGTLAETVALINFETKPGLPPTPPPVWPRQVKVTHVPNKNQIIVIAHPQCGCTQATLQQLAEVTDAAVSVLVYRPDSKSNWGKSPIWQQVRLIKGASVDWDDGGKTAPRFRKLHVGVDPALQPRWPIALSWRDYPVARTCWQKSRMVRVGIGPAHRQPKFRCNSGVRLLASQHRHSYMKTAVQESLKVEKRAQAYHQKSHLELAVQVDRMMAWLLWC